MVEERLILGLPNLNWRRCLQRLWFAVTLFLWGWLAASQLPALLTPPKVVVEAEQVQKLRKLLEQSRQGTLPDTVREELKARLEKGELTNGVRYNVTIVAAGVEERRSYPADQTETQVRDAANLIAQQTQQQAWVRLAVLALLLPLALVLATKLLAWCFAGLSVPFDQQLAHKRQPHPSDYPMNQIQPDSVQVGAEAPPHPPSNRQDLFNPVQERQVQSSGELFAYGDRSELRGDPQSHESADHRPQDQNDRAEPLLGRLPRPPLGTAAGTAKLKI